MNAADRKLLADIVTRSLCPPDDAGAERMADALMGAPEAIRDAADALAADGRLLREAARLLALTADVMNVRALGSHALADEMQKTRDAATLSFYSRCETYPDNAPNPTPETR